MKMYTVAILGATGAVGREMMNILEERNFPVGKLIPLASARSAGKTLKFKGEDVTIGWPATRPSRVWSSVWAQLRSTSQSASLLLS